MRPGPFVVSYFAKNKLHKNKQQYTGDVAHCEYGHDSLTILG